jgi:hypothetical protein
MLPPVGKKKETDFGVRSQRAVAQKPNSKISETLSFDE